MNVESFELNQFVTSDLIGKNAKVFTERIERWPTIMRLLPFCLFWMFYS